MVTREQRESVDKSFKIGQIFVYICGVILHLLLMYAFVKDPLKCLKNLRMSFVISLAISDFLVCLLSLFNVLTLNVTDWSSILSPAIRSIAIVSCFTIASTSVDRLLMIVYPIKHRSWITNKTIAIWLSCVWLVSLFYFSKRYIISVKMNQYEDALYLGSLATLFVVTGIAYTIVCIVLKKQSRNIMEHNESNRNRAGELRLLKEKRFLKTIILIALVAVFACAPGWILLYLFEYKIMSLKHRGYLILLKMFTLFMGINFAINPLIYILRFPNYRKTFKIIYCRQ